MSKEYLDKTGLSYLWGKVKDKFLGKNDTAAKTASIPFGQVDATSTSTVFTATVDGITELRHGICVMLTNGVVASASGYTLNVNGLGAKPVYVSNESSTRSTTGFEITHTYIFVYNEYRINGGCWDAYFGRNTDTVVTKTSELTNDSNFVTIDYIAEAIDVYGSDTAGIQYPDGTTHIIHEASSSLAGCLSAADKTKLDGIATGAEANRTYTAFTGNPTANATPAFGGTFTISQIKQSTTGQVSATNRTVKIPNTEASSTAAGLMSASDKAKLDSITPATSGSLDFVQYSGTYSVAASGSVTGSIDVSRSGYTAVALAGWNLNNTNVIPIRLDVWSDQTVHYNLKNTSTSAQNNQTFYVKVMYVKN